MVVVVVIVVEGERRKGGRERRVFKQIVSKSATAIRGSLERCRWSWVVTWETRDGDVRDEGL